MQNTTAQTEYYLIYIVLHYIPNWTGIPDLSSLYPYRLHTLKSTLYTYFS